MKKAILACLLSVMVFTTAFVVYDHIALANNTEEVTEDEYGGPFRRFMQRRKQQRQMRRQRLQKMEYQDVNGQQQPQMIQSDE